MRIGINYGRRGIQISVGQFQQMWANARVMLQAKEKITTAFAKRAFQAEVETFTEVKVDEAKTLAEGQRSLTGTPGTSVPWPHKSVGHAGGANAR